jgi:hypothetical protein
MLEGSCLCGAVHWGVEGPVTGIECCHCSRCRKATGSAFAPAVAVRSCDFRWLAGEDHVRVFALPVRKRPPPYRRAFCGRCGGPVPLVDPDEPTLEILTGTLDGDPGTRPIQHIYTAGAAPWWNVDDGLPRHATHAGAARIRAQLDPTDQEDGRSSS